jgi:hypothetical protein
MFTQPTGGQFSGKLTVQVATQLCDLHYDTQLKNHPGCPLMKMRSRLWSESSEMAHSPLPTAGQMISEQNGILFPLESKEDMERRYEPDL